MYEKVAIITQIWHRAKCNFTDISNAWDQITVPNMNKITTLISEISQQTLKISEKILIITQILFYMHQKAMVPDHDTQYEENPSTHHGGMHEDGHLWILTDGLDRFLYSPIPLR